MAESIPANFELHIRQPLADGSFPITARVPIADQLVEGRLTFPIGDEATTAFLKDLQEGSVELAAVEEFGARLFNALFQGRIRDLYISVRARQEQAFRYRLILDAPAMARLPWELLYDPERRVFLALETSLVRGFGLGEPTHPLEVQPPLRILISAAFPKDLPTITGQDEIDTILHELADLVHRKDAEVVPLLHVNLRTLQNTLREAAAQGRPFHILHVISHGALEASTGRATLFFEDEQGYAQPVEPAALADLIRPFDLKLVYLNACETAALSTFDLTQGFAPVLLAAGTPAVIGMQVAVWDSVARQVAQDFYAALADNQPVDQALLSARQLARGEAFREASIAIPVCYLRTASGQIVDLIRPRATRLSRATWRDWLTVQATPKRLVRGFLGLVGFVSAVLGIYLGIAEFRADATPTPTPVPPMAGDFTIAVAAFSELDSQGRATESRKGSELAQVVKERIDLEIQDLRKVGFTVDLRGPDQVGFVEGASEVERAQNAAVLAQAIHADLLLYGDLVLQPDNTSLASYVHVDSQKLTHAEELGDGYQFRNHRHSLYLP